MAAVVPFDGHRRLVGRAIERTQLHQILDTTLTGAGQLVLISGEAGIGKTTLIEDVAEKAAELDMLVLSGGCYDLSTTPPYGPWVEILRACPVTTGRSAPPVAVREHGGLEQFESQEQLFRNVASFLNEIAAATPAVLILEDLHWADQASIELLRYLARKVAQQRLLLLVSYRDEELDRDHPLFTILPLLVREARAQRIELQRFDLETLRGLVVRQYGLGTQDCDALATYLLRHTEGNPLFIAELLRSLEREQVLVESENGWQVGQLEAVVPPPLIVQMIERHLTELEPGTREAFEVAAVLGQEIDMDLWQQLAALDDARLLTTIEQGVTGQLIETYGERGLRFRHALIREVLYQGMLFPKRRRIHQRVAETLATQAGAESADADAIAFHFQRAGDRRAVHWLIEAGRQAARAWAGIAASKRYETALQLIKDDPTHRDELGWLYLSLAMTTRDTTARKGLTYAEAALRYAKESGDEGLAAWALWILGQGRCFVGENGLLEMQEGLATLRSLPQVARDRVPAHFKRFDLDYMESSIIIMQALFGYYRVSLAAARVFLERFPAPEDNLLWLEWGHAAVARATALSALGDPEGASEEFRRAKDAYWKDGSAWYVALVATAELQYVTLTYQADHLALRQRQIADVEAVWLEASSASTTLHPRLGLLPLLVVDGSWEEARQIATPYVNDELMFLDHARLALGVIARLQGEPELAWKQIEMGLPDGFDSEPGSHAAGFKVELYRLAADLALDAGDMQLARRWIEAYVRWLDWSGRIQGRADAQMLWARYERLSGDPEQAYRHAEQALELARDPRQPLALAGTYRLLGELDIELGRLARAAEHLQQALYWAEACAAPYEQALVRLAIADLSVAADPDEAWTQIDRARALCAPLGALPALQQAKAIGSRLSVRRGRQMHPAGLTPREVEVLRLVADGLTDAEAAERLYISPRTVGQHLRSVYNKLGVNSRVEAARFAVEQGLTG